MQLTGTEKVDWKKWTREVCSPMELDGQIDDWSCGLFVLMALRCFALRIDYKKWCRDSLKEKMREKCLEALKAIPLRYVDSYKKDNESMINLNDSIKSFPRTIEPGKNSIAACSSEGSAIEVLSTYTTQTMEESSSTAVIQSDNVIANQNNNNAVASSSTRSISSLRYRKTQLIL